MHKKVHKNVQTKNTYDISNCNVVSLAPLLLQYCKYLQHCKHCEYLQRDKDLQQKKKNGKEQKTMEKNGKVQKRMKKNGTNIQTS